MCDLNGAFGKCSALHDLYRQCDAALLGGDFHHITFLQSKAVRILLMDFHLGMGVRFLNLRNVAVTAVEIVYLSGAG